MKALVLKYMHYMRDDMRIPQKKSFCIEFTLRQARISSKVPSALHYLLRDLPYNITIAIEGSCMKSQNYRDDRRRHFLRAKLHPVVSTELA